MMRRVNVSLNTRSAPVPSRYSDSGICYENFLYSPVSRNIIAEQRGMAETWNLWIPNFRSCFILADEYPLIYSCLTNPKRKCNVTHGSAAATWSVEVLLVGQHRKPNTWTVLLLGKSTRRGSYLPFFPSTDILSSPLALGLDEQIGESPNINYGRRVLQLLILIRESISISCWCFPFFNY